MVGQDSVSNDVEEKDRTENQWFGQALCDYPARRDDEVNSTIGTCRSSFRKEVCK
jgi:hypothetical protein